MLKDYYHKLFFISSETAAKPYDDPAFDKNFIYRMAKTNEYLIPEESRKQLVRKMNYTIYSNDAFQLAVILKSKLKKEFGEEVEIPHYEEKLRISLESRKNWHRKRKKMIEQGLSYEERRRQGSLTTKQDKHIRGL